MRETRSRRASYIGTVHETLESVVSTERLRRLARRRDSTTLLGPSLAGTSMSDTAGTWECLVHRLLVLKCRRVAPDALGMRSGLVRSMGDRARVLCGRTLGLRFACMRVRHS